MPRRSCGGAGSWLRFVAGFAAALASEEAPQTHYGIIFDAGSSGSRIHVYTWRSGDSAGEFELVEEDLHKSKPGLSSFAAGGRYSEAGTSLLPLFEKALKKVPAAKWGSTPVYLMATAGLRLVGDDSAAKILSSVADTIATSPFLFRREWVSIMSGTDEGLYGWLTVNYLLGNFKGDGAPQTTGVIDLGGGSVQIVYAADTSVPEPLRSSVTFAGHKHDLYVASHLGLGLDQARDRVAQKLSERARESGESPVKHPCLPAGHAGEQRIGDGSVQAFVGTGAYDACRSMYLELIDRKVPCQTAPCAFNGVHQAPLPDAIFGFSYLYDRTAGIGLLNEEFKELGTANMTINDIQVAAEKLCLTSPDAVKARFVGCEDAGKWANFCGDTSFLVVLLEHGFGIDSRRKLMMGSQVADVDLVWTLGAMIAKSASLRPETASISSKSEL